MLGCYRKEILDFESGPDKYCRDAFFYANDPSSSEQEFSRLPAKVVLEKWHLLGLIHEIAQI